MNFIIKKKYFLFSIYAIYLVIGLYLSLTNGISVDEYYNHLHWQINKDAAINFIRNGSYDELLSYQNRYHGIAFQLISLPVQYILQNFSSHLNDLNAFGGFMISKHSVVFLLFSISGIFFYLLSLKLKKSLVFSFISTSIYLLYPYLFGHAQFNPKDIPFLSFWLINTYISLTLIEDIYNGDKIKISKIIALSFLTAFLISIRVLGVVVFLQYVISIIVLFNIKEINIKNFIKENYLIFCIFIFFLFSFVYILNPILWHNPLELVNSINWMSNFFLDICTLTLGTCMRSLSLPSSYYFIWLFFKLPIIALIGILLFPFVEKKIFNEKNICIYYLPLLLTFFLILFIFIIKNVAVYDELRHVLFLVPIILLIGLTNLYYFNKKLFYNLGTLIIFFFIIENFSLNPYQYTWLNSFAKFTDITKNFEIDYWGISNKNLTKKIVVYSEKNYINRKNICVFGDMYAKEFLENQNFNCFKNYSELDQFKKRPLFVYKNIRNVKRSDPKDCKMIWNETYNYSFYKKKISTGTLWYCN